jgi:hypothetical protein
MFFANFTTLRRIFLFASPVLGTTNEFIVSVMLLLDCDYMEIRKLLQAVWKLIVLFTFFCGVNFVLSIGVFVFHFHYLVLSGFSVS